MVVNKINYDDLFIEKVNNKSVQNIDNEINLNTKRKKYYPRVEGWFIFIFTMFIIFMIIFCTMTLSRIIFGG